ECYLAIFITSGISIYLVIGDYARFVANAILTAVPILLTYVYPEEKPPFDNLLCYWSIYVIATLFLDPKLEDKGSYYWMKMLMLVLLIKFPRKAENIELKQGKNVDNHQEEITAAKNNTLSEKDISDQRSSATQKNQISERVPSLVPQLDSRTENSIYTDDGLQTTPIRESLIVPESKPNPEIISGQELPTASETKSQVLLSNKLMMTYEEISQVTPMKSFQFASIGQDMTSFGKEPQTFCARKLESSCSKEQNIIPVKRNQIIPLKESKSFTIREYKISSGSDKKIHTVCVKDSERLEIPTGRKFKEHQNISMRKPQNVTTNEVPLTPLTISTPVSIKHSQNISSKETKKPQFVSEHDLRTISVVESHILPAGKSKVPDASAKFIKISEKEHQILHNNKAVSISETETMVQKPSPAKSQLSSWKKSDAVTEAKTQINHTKKIINTNKKQSLLTSSASISLERNEDSEKEISQNTAEAKKLASVIRWVATGKTVVIIKNMQTGEMTDAHDTDELHNHLRSLVFDQVTIDYRSNQNALIKSSIVGLYNMRMFICCLANLEPSSLMLTDGRGLRLLREQTGLDEFSLAIFICVITSVYLMIGEDAQMLANAILTVTPILLTYVFPAEKPPTPQLLIYWSAFGLLTLLDSNFESESGYYFIKVVLLALLFLHPFDGADRILWHIRLAHSDEVKDERGIIPFTKEELSEMLHRSKDRRSLPPGTPETMKLNSASSYALRSDYSSSYDSVPEDKNPMLFNTEFRIQDQEGTSAEGLSINYSPHDLAFEPSKYLIFNAPYDFDNLTYLIRIRNTSTKHIAYAIKSNAIPRVFATPPCGILPPKQKCDIAVTVKVMTSI
ncbi:unnamed protein product, partial [Brugia timori]|uniref:Major sperm protein n=1 Tax=Brugia timori TaxID=42155 RepID=A0A0R3Q3G4_9BILA